MEFSLNINGGKADSFVDQQLRVTVAALDCEEFLHRNVEIVKDVWVVNQASRVRITKTNLYACREGHSQKDEG